MRSMETVMRSRFSPWECRSTKYYNLIQSPKYNIANDGNIQHQARGLHSPTGCEIRSWKICRTWVSFRCLTSSLATAVTTEYIHPVPWKQTPVFLNTCDEGCPHLPSLSIPSATLYLHCNTNNLPLFSFSFTIGLFLPDVGFCENSRFLSFEKSNHLILNAVYHIPLLL